MAFITPCLKSFKALQDRPLLIFALIRIIPRTAFCHLAAAAFFFAAQTAYADGISVKSAELELVDEVYELNATFDINLTPALEEAANKGIPLNFVIETEFTLPYQFWLDETIAQVEQHIRLSYLPLTRQYRLSSNGVHKNFSTLAEAKQELSSVNRWQVLDRSLVKKRYTYEAAVRMRLDASQLPKPLQIFPFRSKELTLESEWRRWTFTP